MLRKKFIIAIGASAGGQEAMSQFFDYTHLNGVSYVIVTHLAPFYKSQLADILQKRSRIQVCIAEHGMIIQPNVVYVMPENRMMTITDGKLQLEDRDLSVVSNNAINVFFTSFAKDTMFDKIAIILSGMGVDGTIGVKALKQSGAYVIAQTSSSSGESSMPDSIVADGLADEILEPKYMPDAIIKWLDNKILNGSN
jgi:two-component system CheB/CheR fusion protein